jgi:ankyrin repeat protein
MWAVQIGSRANAEGLLNAGADPNIANIKGETALTISKKHNYTEITDMLIKAGAKE